MLRAVYKLINRLLAGFEFILIIILAINGAITRQHFHRSKTRGTFFKNTVSHAGLRRGEREPLPLYR